MIVGFNKCKNLGHCGEELCIPEFCHKYDPIIPTNADRIRVMSDEELAKFLCSLAFAGETPWSDPFVEKFCKNCPTVKAIIEGFDKEMELSECDFVDGECPHGDDVVWWLKQPAEGADNG